MLNKTLQLIISSRHFSETLQLTISSRHFRETLQLTISSRHFLGTLGDFSRRKWTHALGHYLNDPVGMTFL